MSTINKLQQKTEQEKVVFAAMAAIAVVVILFGIWGYNFAHSGKINILANSASGVASAVERSNIGESFGNALEQLKSLDVGDVTSGQAAGMDAQQDSVGTKHMNVFANPDTATGGTTSTEQYGKNSADVLY